MAIFFLIWGGFNAVVGNDEDGNPLLGALALAGGVLVVLWIALFFRPRRPRR